MKIKLYNVPHSKKVKHVKSVDLDQVKDLMAGLVDFGLRPSMDHFSKFGINSVLPGGEEANEAFQNMELLKRITGGDEEIKPLILPTAQEIKKTNVIKYIYDYLYNEHKGGYALTLGGVQTSIENLLKTIQADVMKTKDVSLADFIFDVNMINNDLHREKYPGLFSQSMPWGRRIPQAVLEIKVDKFFRDQYKEDHEFSDIDEIIKLAELFSTKYPLGVPKDTVESLFIDRCPCK